MTRLMRSLLTVLLVLTLAACVPGQTPGPNLANPASVYCQEQGGALEIRDDGSGGQAGYCLFADGSECDEWAYFRGECSPGDSLALIGPTAPPAQGWVAFLDADLGLRFEYPEIAEVIVSGEAGSVLNIRGPMTGYDYWPMIFVNLPVGSAAQSVPPEADLGQWLVDHNLLYWERMPDAQIAGTAAVHMHIPPREEAYESDVYYFVHNGYLYSIILLHTNNLQDWDLYNHLLESVRFDG